MARVFPFSNTPPPTTHPQLFTKAATSAVLSGGGDALAQFVIEGKRLASFDGPRCGRFALLGGILVGPALHVWYGALAKTITATGTAGE